MANLFGDQLLKAGLVKKDQLNKAKKSKHKQKVQKGKQPPVVSEATAAVQQAAAEKTARDSELNRQKKEAAERKAIQAQIRQLIELNELTGIDGDVGYNFQDDTAIKKIFVSDEIHGKLQSGHLTIARFNGGYTVIPSIVADKIRLRDESSIIGVATPEAGDGSDDPYEDYKVPDDLMW
ncbi:MAG: DUF2058 domain-containing protein [Gammaproteobacteria bacterium]